MFATVRKEADAAGLTAPKGAKGRIVPLICDICDVDSLVEARAIVERECEAGGKDLQGIVNNAGKEGNARLPMPDWQWIHGWMEGTGPDSLAPFHFSHGRRSHRCWQATRKPDHSR